MDSCATRSWAAVLTLVVQDLVSGDEIISDSYDLKDVDDVVFEVDCKMIKTGGDSFGQSLSPLPNSPAAVSRYA